MDMNQYNLNDSEQIAKEWTAVARPATPLQEAGIYLAAQSSQDLFVDTIAVQLPRVEGQGLGLELMELAGGRGDGIGITIVSGVVPGGCAEGSGIEWGDSISQVQVVGQAAVDDDNMDGLVEQTTVFAVSTECLDYDQTVTAIGSLPPHASGAETVVLTLKRLRRKPKVKINFQYPPEMQEKNISIELFAGENLRRSMLVKGLKLNDPLARRFDSGGSGDCGAEGTCATCAVAITQGDELASPQGIMEKQLFQNNPRWRLSCKTVVGHGMREGEMTVRLSPRQWDTWTQR